MTATGRCLGRVQYASVRGVTFISELELKVGDHVEVESESTERSPRPGVIEEVVQEAPSPRYRIRWDDGHESLYAPAAGALRRAEPAKNA